MNLDTVTSLQTDFGRIYDENFKPIDKTVYSKQIDDFNKKLEAIGISSKLSPNEIELKLQQIYEILMKVPKFSDQRPADMPAKTTINATESADLIEKAEKLAKQNADIKAREKQTVEDFIDKNQAKIAKAQAVQDKLKDKVVYAKVIIPEPLPLDEIEKQDLSTLREYAQGSEETKQKLIDDLANQIETKLENIPEEQRELIARTAAVEIVNKLAKPETAYGEQIQNSILAAVREDKKKVLPTIFKKDDDLLIAAKNGSTLLELENRNRELTTKNIARNIFGPKLTLAIYGPEQFEVILSETKNEEQTHQVDLGRLNENYIRELQHQNTVLNTVKEFGIDRTKDYFSGQFTSYARTYIEKAATTKAGAIFKDPIIQSIFARYGLAKPVVWQATENISQFGGLLMKISPKTAGPVLEFAGRMTGIESVTPITTLTGGAIGVTIAAQAATTYTSVALSGGVMAAEAFAGGAGGAAAGAAAGSVVPVVGTIIGAIAGFVGGELLKPIFSKAKVWWTENKEKIKPVLAVAATITAIRFLGVGPGLAVGGVATFGLLGTVGVAAVATGTFRVLGFIGRSVGVAIATPVIITLLVIPPLVALIMLVINNSAYVVPPDAKSLGLNVDNPYILVTKVAKPDKFINPTTSKVNVTYTVTIKALKSTLSNLSIIETKCTVSKKNASTILQCPPELENIPALPTGLTVSPSSSYSFTFTSEFDSKYADSAIFDTIKIKGDSVEEAGIETSGSESVCIGDCPHGCFEISNNNEGWPSGFGSNLENATQELTSRFPNFVDKVCSEGKTINLCYTTKDPSPIGSGLCNNTIYARHVHGDDCDINFNQCSLDGDPKDAFFLLTHELTHHVERVDGSIIDRYRNSGAPNELPLCSYSGTNGDNSEGAAEANALYANGGTAGFSTCSMNFINQYPKNYSFARDYMNNP